MKKQIKISVAIILVIFLIIATNCRPKVGKDSIADNSKVMISLDLESPGNLSFVDIVDSVTYITLETSEEIVIGSINKVIFTKDRIFIGDIDNTQSISCFDNNGNFVFKIQKRGRAPDEYGRMNDFDIDEEAEIVIVHDSQMRAFVLYDYSGVFVDRFVHGYLFQSFKLIEKESVIVYSDYISNPTISRHPNSNVFVFDYKTKKVEETLLTFDSDLGLEMKILGLVNNFSINHEICYIYDYYTNAIFSFENSTFSKRFEIDFGNKRIPEDFWLNANSESLKEGINEGRFYGGLINFQVIGEWVIGYYPSKARSNLFIYNTANHNSYPIRTVTPFRDGFPIFSMPPFHTDGDRIVSIIEPIWVVKMIEGGIPEILIPQELREINLNSNPIIQLIKLK